MSDRQLARVRRWLLDWYRTDHRDLPWRRTQDPYAIWVSEVMLQQTQVATVAPRYLEFLDRYPDVASLAHADETEVCEAWAGLGYYRRARNLHAAARLVLARHGGRLPSDVAGLVALPGIGRYTAGAIASICFGVPAPAVDGNVARVLSRLFATTATGQLWSIAGRLVRGDAPGDLNQALMDLGARICTPRAPACTECPVRRVCRGCDNPERYPRPARSPAKQTLQIAFAWLQGRAGVWLERRPVDGLWAGLWELPSACGRRARAELAERLGVVLLGPIARVEHALSHRAVRARIFRPAHALRLRAGADRRRWPDPLKAPLSALARKAIIASRKSGHT